MRVHYKKKTHRVRVDHQKKSGRVTVHIRKRGMGLELTMKKIDGVRHIRESDGVRIHHKKER